MARYRIDPARSRVWIDARSSVHPIRSQAGGLSGWLELDLGEGYAGEQRGHLEFPVENLKSGNPLEDREMHRRVDSRRYPSITGDLHMLRPAEGGASNGHTHVVGGDLTFRGVTRSYEHEMKIEAIDATSQGETLKLAGQSTFDIRDFGMEPPRILLLKVYPDVTVRVEIIAEKEH